MADWGLYSALRGTDDWATKRQDQQMNLLAAEKMEQRQQLKVAQSAAAETSIAKYMEELQNLEVLPEDQERVSQAEKQARQRIVKGIANSNGDLKKYMSTGGITALNDYKTSVMQSEEVKQAGINKINLGNYLKQESKGNQRHKLVDVAVPMEDANGNPILDAEGNQQTETKKMTFQEQYNLYKAGKIKQLNYSGSETRINLGVEDFNRMYKNPRNKYQKDNYVTESNIYEKALSKGASEEYAREQAKRYGEMYKAGGDAWRWNSGDINELKLKQQELSLKRKALKQQKDAFEFNRFKNKAMVTHDVNTAIKNLQEGSSHKLGVSEIPFWKEVLQMKENSDGSVTLPKFNKKGVDPLTGDLIEIQGAYDIYYDKIVARKDEATGKTVKYLEADVTLPDPSSHLFQFGGYEYLPVTDAFGATTVKNKHADNWSTDWSGNASGKVLIPIQDKLDEATFQTQMDKYINVKTDHLWNAPTLTDEISDYQAYQDIMAIKERLPEGVSLDQALIDQAKGTFENIDYEE
jgi:hypothetical protein